MLLTKSNRSKLYKRSSNHGSKSPTKTTSSTCSPETPITTLLSSLSPFLISLLTPSASIFNPSRIPSIALLSSTCVFVFLGICFSHLRYLCFYSGKTRVSVQKLQSILQGNAGKPWKNGNRGIELGV